jgi:spore coat polysaccharide biosynthesis protein SpsF
LKQLLPAAKFAAVEINARAVAELRRLPWLDVVHDSLLNLQSATAHDFVLIKGVMIHLNPDVLPQVYRLLHDSTSRYVCVAEYYNPTPVTVGYRGHAERLFKRDFAGELMRAYPDLRLVDYGFVYRGDANFPQDDLTWFLMEKPT